MKSTILFTITLLVAIALFIGGFLVPPTGVIDGSVLTAAGILLGFGALAQVPTLIRKGADFTLTHGSTSLQVNNPDNDDEENEE